MRSEVLLDWQQQAQDYLVQGRYAQATQLYEQAIETEPNQRSYYWHLGLLLLLQEQEEEAQTTWLLALSECEPDEVDLCVQELSQILQAEAERREALAEYSIAWVIRQHLREVCSTNIDNLLRIIGLSIELSLFTDEMFEDIGILEQLRINPPEINLELVRHTLSHVLLTAPASPLLLDFIDACAQVLEPGVLMWVLLPAVMRFGYTCFKPAFAAEIAELFLKIEPTNIEFLSHLAPLYQNAKNYDRGIETAKRRYELVDHLAEKAFSNNLVLRGLLNAGGYWQEALEVAQRHEALLDALIAEQPTDLDPVQTARLLNLGYHLVYFKDDPQGWRNRQNQLLAFCQERIQAQAAERGKHFPHSKRDRTNQRLKIGYLSHCMAMHSVGWLARWLFQHHDREQFELYGYFVNYRDLYDPLQEFYVQQVDHAHQYGTPHIDTYLEIADRIYQDEVDILIDLDSLTLDTSCEVLALKPAPIQVTWLGWDASGLPAIDYFIADPHVLPNNAQDYYSEKIWRLSQTYLAIDGFEVDVPTLRRSDLDIPEDAIVFLSAQRGYKRHRETAKAQMQIVKQVPNSYFLIKGLSDEASIQAFFYDIAAEEGVALERLRFLSDSHSSQAHRANLAIADVVLDTFPYNGATTTLETLWMGVPIVTRVGEQFAARNSYTMMTNVGVTEGIAFSNDEYIEWGVRLGTDKVLRQQVAWKLRQSRQTSPLWNAKQFTREMEQAYEQMWAIYMES
jgi:predicted O-linked N-acetylglucosamine transferase (SPINDLY family)